jgi:hypothetical protein
MLILVLCVIAVVSPLLVGRWPAGLLLHRWGWVWLIWAALLLQLAIMPFALFREVAPVLHVLSYVLSLLFLWFNRSQRGALLVGLGALLNGVTIALNGGTLPSRAEAVAAAGLSSDREFANSAVLENPVLPWLGDAFAWPAPFPLANVFSVGDVLIVVGVWVAAWSGTRRWGDKVTPATSALEIT